MLQEDAMKVLPLAEGDLATIKDGRGRPISVIGLAVIDDLGNYHQLCREELTIIRPPRLRPWNSIEEMGEAVNHWFKHKPNNALLKLVFLCEGDPKPVGFPNQGKVNLYTLTELNTHFEHTPTPWLADTWKPCGVKEEDGK